MGIMLRERAQETPLMVQKWGGYVCGDLQPEPQLPSGWEKCLDLKSGLIYFKDWNSGTLTYRDPRQAVASTAQRIGMLSISLSSEDDKTVKSSLNAREEESKRYKRIASIAPDGQPAGRSWALTTAQMVGDSDSSDRETTSMSMDEENDQSLELTLNLPGMSIKPSSFNQEDSVCTMEKVRCALERSQWLKPPQQQKKRAACNSENNFSETLFTALSLLSPRPSSSLESNSLGLQNSTCSKSASPASSRCSSEGLTSPSVISHQGDEEEVQQPRFCGGIGAKSQAVPDKSQNLGEVMVTVGCKSCFMYVMLSKSHPSCPKCGNTDVLLELPSTVYPSLPKKQRISLDSPTWNWCTA